MTPHRLPLPLPDHPVHGWCLYLNDRWDGENPQEQDELGFIVYADKNSAFVGLARELRLRLSYFEAGKWYGGDLETRWYPMPVRWYADGHLIDSNNREQWPDGDILI